jgi:MFS family permease
MNFKNPWFLVGLLWIVALLNYLDRQLITTMGNPIMASLQMDSREFGLCSSIFLWVYGLCSPVAGFLADRLGRRQVILASLSIWSAATLLTGQVRTFEEMLLARAIMGISEACYIPAALALIVENHPVSTRSRATGLHLSGSYAGSILGGLGGMIAVHWGWRAGFQVFGVVGLVYAAFLALVLPGSRPGRAGASTATAAGFTEAFAGLLGSRSMVILLIMNATMGAAYWTIKNWLPLFFSSEIGVKDEWSGIYGATAFNSAAFAGMLLAGTIADRWAQRNPRARVLVPAIGFCVAAPCFFLAGFSSSVPVLLLAVIIVGMGQGALDANLMPSVCLVADARCRATGYGLLNFVGTTTGGVMTFVAGWLKREDVPLGVTFQAASAFILVAGLLLFAVRVRPTLAVEAPLP